MSTAPSPAATPGWGVVVRALVRGLVDDAAVFPPGLAPMPDAVAAHLEHTHSWYADLLGPFLVPAGQVEAFADAVGRRPAGTRLRAGVLADAASGDPLAGALPALRALGALPAIEPVVLEVPLPAGTDQGRAAAELLGRLRAVPDGVRVWVEVRAEGGWQDALRRIGAAGDGVGAKFRTGGVTADAVPPVPVLARFVRAAVDAGTPFKLTAGLHAAVAGPHADLSWQHGVLNVLVATRTALVGGDADDVAEVLATTDAALLASQVRRMDDAAASGVRGQFASFGCCGVLDPIRDLVALGLVEESR